MGLFAACQKPPELTATPAESNALEKSVVADAGIPEAVHHVARRCGECHERHFEEWKPSAHAAASVGLFARAAQSLPASTVEGCLGCHAPLRAGGRRFALDGVSCDACHTAVSVDAPPNALVLKPELATKFGPFRDAKDHHFHRMAQSDFVDGSGLCLGCHEDRRTSTTLKTVTSADEWRASAYADISCPSCHMAAFDAPAAKGEKTRSVTRHDFGVDRSAALGASISVAFERPAGKPAQVTLLNHAAGHALPTDFPDRRLHLTVTFEKDGQPLRSEERWYGRTLVNDAGETVPFFLATRELKDTRLLPDVPRTESFPVAQGSASARVTLEYVRFDPALIPTYGALPAPAVLFDKSFPLARPSR